MKDTPILMNSEMVRQTLADRKGQTRRVMRPQPVDIGGCMEWKGKYVFSSASPSHVCPYGTIGDRLIIKEASWMWCERRPNGTTPKGRQKWHYVPLISAPVYYLSERTTKPSVDVVSPNTGNKWMWKYKVGRFMPRWASRITLEITNIRVERVQDISEEDAKNEGITVSELGRLASSTLETYKGDKVAPAILQFAHLWNLINESRGFGWDKNVWVWVVNFRRVEK